MILLSPKLTSLCIFLTCLFLFVSCTTERNPDDASMNDPARSLPHRNADDVEVVVRGENSVVVFEGNLQRSIEMQQPPSVWIEFSTPDGLKIRTDFPKDVVVELHKLWAATLELCFRDLRVNGDGQRLELHKEYLNNNAKLIAYLEAQQISTPSGRRTLEGEAIEITRLVNYLAIRRFSELKAMDQTLQGANSSSISN